MNTRYIFIIDAVLAILFGIGLIIFPIQLLSLFDITSASTGINPLTQLLGATLIGIGLTEWLARNKEEEQNIPIIRGMLILDILAVIISIRAIYLSHVNQLGWIITIIFLFFALSRTYLGFFRASIKN